MADVRLPGINHTALDGRVGREPELKYTSGGVAYCKFSLANTEFFKGADGSRQERTLWLDVVCWNASAEYVAKSVHKGDALYVEGKLAMREWEDRLTGQKRSKLELSAGKVSPMSWPDKNAQPRNEGGAAPAGPPPDDYVPEDDIPF